MPQQAEKQLGSGDILILAGDIINARYLEREPKCHFSTFLHLARQRFKHVVAIAGNHESYHYNYKEMQQFMKDYYELHEVTYLNNASTVLDGVTVYGGPLWTDFNFSEEAMDAGMMNMNDFRFISKTCKPNKFGIQDRLWIPQDTIEEHLEFLTNLRKESNVDIVVSHHAPSAKSIPEKFKNDFPLNYAYFSNLEEVIKKHSPQLWVHGHMHEASDYMVGDTRVYCNPWGYRHENNQLKLNEVLDVQYFSDL